MKRTLYVLALGIFGIATTEFGVIGILPQIASAFKISIDKAGWLLSAFAIIIAVFGPFTTLLFSGMDRKKAMTFVLAVFTISNIISALATTFPVLLFARILPAFLHPVFWSIGLATAAAAVPSAESPRAVSIVFGGFTIASVLGIPLATFMAAMFNWQAAFVLCAMVNGISLIGLLVLLPPMPAIARISYGTQLQIFRKPALWSGLLLAFLMITAMYATYGYLAAYLGTVTKMNGSQISLMLLVFGISGVGGNWLAGKLLSKNIVTTTLVFIVLLCLAHVLVYIAGFQFVPMLVTICVWGFIHTGGFLISNVNVTIHAREAPAFVNSIFTSCGNLAVTIGAAIGGMAIARIGVHQIVWTSVGLLLLALLVGLFSRVMILRKTRIIEPII
ncbi:putative MFS family arabinose efflux permease [Chitinophaga niastensis]|uniref:Putative MFS family arabinose efflux permease n=1 Tax=Chitinophaga niastensis TaxID=536980 RepID=A0A2P8HCD1_CHINA|nr:MFS transporter [Chitinophaga niastensis]PSL43889.1 putative MFS family arabinose efflux permease [Chitinophaga niastensis]